MNDHSAIYFALTLKQTLILLHFFLFAQFQVSLLDGETEEEERQRAHEYDGRRVNNS